jgi:hypothetical protein
MNADKILINADKNIKHIVLYLILSFFNLRLSAVKIL